jgi:hypothetical protein
MQKWEYLPVVLNISNEKELKDWLAQAGEAGWELVSTIPEIGAHERHAFSFFKRPKPGTAEALN